jgi:hypothetical protein
MPSAKAVKRIPPMISPLLKSGAVMPLCTPKSLRALFVQLKGFQEPIATAMHANVIKGAIKPMAAEISSLFFNLPILKQNLLGYA